MGGSYFSRLGRVINRLEELFIAILLAAMVVITFIQVVLRYGFGSGILWGMEVTTYLFGWLVLFGASHLMKKRGHIGVDALVRILPRFLRRVIMLASALGSLFYAGVLFVGGWNYVSAMYTVGIKAEDVNIPRWILLSIIPIGFALLFIRLAQIAWCIWTEKGPGFYIPVGGRGSLSRMDQFISEKRAG
jgi:C4-dicarboxylate transporter DctQ subunit